MEPSAVAHYQSETWDLHIGKCYGRLVLEGFVKSGETLKHLVHGVDDTDFLAAFDLTLRYGRVVKRPYLLGQRCDGSIGVPVMALYLDFCSRHSLDAQALHERAYPGERKLEPEATTGLCQVARGTNSAYLDGSLLSRSTGVANSDQRKHIAKRFSGLIFPWGRHGT